MVAPLGTAQVERQVGKSLPGTLKGSVYVCSITPCVVSTTKPALTQGALAPGHARAMDVVVEGAYMGASFTEHVRDMVYGTIVKHHIQLLVYQYLVTKWSVVHSEPRPKLSTTLYTTTVLGHIGPIWVDITNYVECGSQ